jgi:FMN-dependent NADH-azoreductase
MKLLRIDSSARKQSVSRRLTTEFVDAWKKRNPEGVAIERDLTATPLPLVNDGWVAAAHTGAAQRTEEHKQALALSDELIGELTEADVIVMGVPMYNFAIPANLKAWIDQIVRMGVTFAYGATGPKGLLSSKKVFVLTSRGGAYEPGSMTEKFDFQAPYLKHILGFIGITDVTFIHAENQSKETATASLAAAAKQIQQAATL